MRGAVIPQTTKIADARLRLVEAKSVLEIAKSADATTKAARAELDQAVPSSEDLLLCVRHAAVAVVRAEMASESASFLEHVRRLQADAYAATEALEWLTKNGVAGGESGDAFDVASRFFQVPMKQWKLLGFTAPPSLFQTAIAELMLNADAKIPDLKAGTA